MQLFLLSSVLLAVSLCSASPPGLSEVKLVRGNCPMFWFGFNGRCYKYVATHMTWADAELHCLSQGANLVSIHSLEENNFVKSLIQNFDHSQDITWIGLSDVAKEGAWMWTDGSRVDFTLWRKGEPNNSGQEDCGHLYFKIYGDEWNDIHCSLIHPSVCASHVSC